MTSGVKYAFDRNCAFQKEAHRAMLVPDTEQVAIPPSKVTAPGIDLTQYLLLPLCGPEEFDLEVCVFL